MNIYYIYSDISLINDQSSICWTDSLRIFTYKDNKFPNSTDIILALIDFDTILQLKVSISLIYTK